MIFHCIGLVNIIGVSAWGGVVLTNISYTISLGLVDLTQSPELEKCLKNWKRVHTLALVNTNTMFKKSGLCVELVQNVFMLLLN